MKHPVVLLLLGALLLTLPILGTYSLGGHDLLYYFLYGQQTAANLREGVWLPAWAPDLNYGFGGPALMFYPPLVNFAHGVLLVMGVPLWKGVGILTFLAALLSGLTALLWLRSLAPTPAALAGALVYMLAPYRVIDIYERTALAEHWAFIYPPLILWAIGTRRIAVVAFATAALVMTNVPLAVLFGLAIAAFVLATRSFAVAAAGAALGFAMAAMSLVPQALATRLLHVELWFGARQYRASLNTIFSAAGDDPAFNTRVSLVVVATFAIACVAAFAARSRFWIVLAAIAFVATTPLAGPVWDAIPALSRLQFPWRATAVLTLALAVLTAQTASARPRIAVVALTLLAAIPFYGRSMLPQELFAAPPPPARLFPDSRAVHEVGGAEGNRMHQRLVDVWFIPRTVAPPTLDRLQSPDPRLGGLAESPAFLPGARVRILRWRRLERTIAIDAPAAGTLVWHSFWFPEMDLIVDGRATSARPVDATGIAATPLSAGRHEVTWRWRPFRELVIARWISLAGLVATIVIAATARTASRPPSPPPPPPARSA